MNGPGTHRYSTTALLVGTTPVVVSVEAQLDPALGYPPIRGDIISVEIEQTGGPGSTVTTQIKEGAGGALRFATTDSLPGPNLVPAQPPMHYQVSAAGDLVIELTTDDAGNTDTIVVTVEIEGPK